jgi:hypothetical protein
MIYSVTRNHVRVLLRISNARAAYPALRIPSRLPEIPIGSLRVLQVGQVFSWSLAMGALPWHTTIAHQIGR